MNRVIIASFQDINIFDVQIYVTKLRNFPQINQKRLKPKLPSFSEVLMETETSKDKPYKYFGNIDS